MKLTRLLSSLLIVASIPVAAQVQGQVYRAMAPTADPGVQSPIAESEPLPSFAAWLQAGDTLAVATCTNGQTRWIHMGSCCEFGPLLEEQECRFGGFWMFTGETQCTQGFCSQW